MTIWVVPRAKGTQNDFRIRISFKIFRESANTGGKLAIGVGFVSAVNLGINSSSTYTFTINVLDYPVSGWTTVNLSKTISLDSAHVIVPAIFRVSGSWITGGRVYISEFFVEEDQLTQNVPQITAGSAYILKLGDQGRHIYISTGGVTVPPATDVDFPVETIVTIVNNSGGNQTITQGSGVTLRLAGTNSTGDRILALYGIATLLKVAANTWVISGAGLT